MTDLRKKLASAAFLTLTISFTTGVLAQTTIPIPDGEITINPDGSFTGTHEWIGVYPDFPDEVDKATISGTISKSGQITGTFTGTSTFNVHIGEGVVVQQEEPIQGTISGSINPDGTYTVYWSGTESGSHSGAFPAFNFEFEQESSSDGPSAGGSSQSDRTSGGSEDSSSGPTPPPPGPDGGNLGGFGFTYDSGSSKMCEV